MADFKNTLKGILAIILGLLAIAVAFGGLYLAGTSLLEGLADIF